MRAAIGDEAIALRLHEFVRFYKPKIWVVPISNVDFTPHFSAEQIPALRRGEIDDERWYVRDAIKAFFDKEKG